MPKVLPLPVVPPYTGVIVSWVSLVTLTTSWTDVLPTIVTPSPTRTFVIKDVPTPVIDPLLFVAVIDPVEYQAIWIP
ncbi:hypothetical protein D3C75_1002820 [compost metagenome]